MAKRLRADLFFTPQKDFYCLSYQLLRHATEKWHCHEFYEVEIITSGTAIDKINGVPYVLNRGSFILLAPNDFHYIKTCVDGYTHLVNLAVSVPLMEEILSFLEISAPESLAFPITGTLPQELIHQLTEHASELLLPSRNIPQNRALAKQWMTTCLLCSSFSARSQENGKIPVWLLHLLSKLKTPEGIQGGIEYLKAHTDRSYPHVCRCFKKYLQQTPVEWINEQRMIYSTHLLLHTEQSILEISLECGFHNLSHFNHLFKAFYGISPSTMRSLL